MPITNLFFHTIPNPFHSKHRKTLSSANLHGLSHHERPMGATSANRVYSTNSPDVASPTSTLKHKRFSFDKWKVRKESSTANVLDKGKQRKSTFSKKDLPSPSPPFHGSPTTETLSDPTTAIEAGGNGNDGSGSHDEHGSSGSSSGSNNMPVLLSDLKTPTSASFGASPLSPHVSIPPSPATPCSSTTPHGRDILTASPEPITPSVSKSPSTTQLNQSPSHGPGLGVASKLGSFFSSKSGPGSGVVDAASNEDALPAPLPRKKRMSANSLQLAAPIGAFLSSTFRPKHPSSPTQEQARKEVPMQNEQGMPGGQEHGDLVHLPQQHQQEQHQQPLQKRKKRKSLLPKLPKLDTHPRILITGVKADQPKKSKGMAVAQPPASPLKMSEDGPAPEPRSPSMSMFLRSGALLSPFHLPSKTRSKSSKERHTQLGTEGQRGGKHGGGTLADAPQMDSGSTRGEVDSYPAQKDTDGRDLNEAQLRLNHGANMTDWRQHSEPYYDERWDRASILTVDSEWVHLSDDPSFPGYPERNAFWQKHCRIRERRRKKSPRLSVVRVSSFSNRNSTVLLPPVPVPAPAPVSVLPDNGPETMAENEVDLEKNDAMEEDDQPQDDQLSDMTDMQQSSLPDMSEFTETDLSRRSSRASNATTSTLQGHGPRVRYSSYSAYIAAMKQEPNQTDRKRSLEEQDRISRNGSESSLPRVSSRLLEDMRRLKERSVAQQEITPQHNFVQAMADRFETPTASDSESTLTRVPSDNVPKVASRRRPSQVHCPKRSLDGINLGSSDEEEDQELEEGSVKSKALSVSGDRTLRQRRQPNSGILFVSAETAEPKLSTVTTTTSQDPMTMMMLEGASNTPTIATAKSTLDKQDSSLDAVQSSRSPGAHSDPSDACSSASLHGDCDQSRSSVDSSSESSSNSNKASFDKDGSLICRPGQYASQNHIMPLDKLLLLEERQRLERSRPQGEKQPLGLMRHHDALDQSKSGPGVASEAASEATGWAEDVQHESQQEGAETLHVLAPAAIVEPLQSPRSSGHMLLMLRNGKFQYYINGARNDSLGSEEDDDSDGTDTYSDEEESALDSGGAHQRHSFHRRSTSIIKEEEEETDEEDLRDLRRQSYLSVDTSLAPSRSESLRRPYRSSFYGARWKGKAIDRSEVGSPDPESEPLTCQQESDLDLGAHLAPEHFVYDHDLAGPSSVTRVHVAETGEILAVKEPYTPMTANSSESHLPEDVPKEPPSRRASITSVPLMQHSSSSRPLMVTPPSTVTVSRSSSLAIPSTSLETVSASASLAAAASLISPPISPPSSPPRQPISRSQSRALGTKSRPSVSCSCHPTMAQPVSTSYTSLVAIASAPSTTSLSSAQLVVAAAAALSTVPATASMRRRESGSSWLSGGGPGSANGNSESIRSGYDTPESPSSPTATGSFHWPEVTTASSPASTANSGATGTVPISATALLDSILSRPMKTAYALQDPQRKPSRALSTPALLPTSSTTMTTAGAASSTPWIRRSLLRSATTIGTSTSNDYHGQGNRVIGGGSSVKSAGGSGSGWSSPRSPPSSRPSSPFSSPRRQVMLDVDEIVADLEMAQELSLRQDDETNEHDHDTTTNNDNVNENENESQDNRDKQDTDGDKSTPSPNPNNDQPLPQKDEQSSNTFNRWGAALHSSLVGVVLNNLIRSNSSNNTSSGNDKAVAATNAVWDHSRRASHGDRDQRAPPTSGNNNTQPRKRTRALSMVDLSVSAPVSRPQSTTTTTTAAAMENRGKYKAEPSTSTSTMDTLHSGKDMYQWSDFFDM